MYHVFHWPREHKTDNKTTPHLLVNQQYKKYHTRRRHNLSLQYEKRSHHSSIRAKRRWPSCDIDKYQVINYL
jgi:hypothetical protein